VQLIDNPQQEPKILAVTNSDRTRPNRERPVEQCASALIKASRG